MGYTNYWTIKKEITQETWAKIVEDCKKLYENLPEYSESAGGYYLDAPLILNGGGYYQKPQFTKKHILFNGGSCPTKDRVKDERGYWFDNNNKDLGHEIFDLTPLPRARAWDSSLDGFGFCKTARKPYDLMVKACLLICKEYLGDGIEISCDGDDEDWKPAIAFILSTLDRVSPDSFSMLVA
jgi:hypothetical protein